MRDMGLAKMDEPFTRLLTQGMVLNHIYLRRNAKGGIDYYAPDDVEVMHDADGHVTGARLKADGRPVDYGGVGTMSKSKLNGVDPQEIVDRYGADAARLFVMFAAHPEATLEWSDAGVEGATRFLKRLWTFAQAHVDGAPGKANERMIGDLSGGARAARRELHLTLKQANYDYERIQYNTVVSAAMKMLNALEALPADAAGAANVIREGLSILLRVLYPVAPHTTWVLWRDLGFAREHGDLLDAAWPDVDPEALAQDEIELVLQVNGKLRGKLVVPAAADRAAIEAAARASAEVARHANGAPVKKVVVVPGRLVNVVV
jgi:leucyl-tRNA synthetase